MAIERLGFSAHHEISSCGFCLPKTEFPLLFFCQPLVLHGNMHKIIVAHVLFAEIIVAPLSGISEAATTTFGH